jgi:glutathione S-transferase
VLTIWGRRNAFNVQKAMWAVGEVGLDHERIDVGGPFGGLDTPAFGALNPNRSIPVLRDGDTVVWESNVIVRYLAAKYGADALWSPDPAERAAADQWMDWMQTTLLRDFIDLFYALVRKRPERRDWPKIRATNARLAIHYRLLDRHLAGRPFLAGEQFSMADIPAGTTLYRYFEMEIERPVLPQVEAWYARLKNRPAYRRHVMIPFDDLCGIDD